MVCNAPRKDNTNGFFPFTKIWNQICFITGSLISTYSIFTTTYVVLSIWRCDTFSNLCSSQDTFFSKNVWTFTFKTEISPSWHTYSVVNDLNKVHTAVVTRRTYFSNKYLSGHLRFSRKSWRNVSSLQRVVCG